MRPQHGHVWLVYAAGTATNAPPFHRGLYSSLLRKSPQPWSRRALFKPFFCATFLPGASSVPDADFDMLRTCKSSIHTIAWFLLICVEALCRKSFRAFAMLL